PSPSPPRAQPSLACSPPRASRWRSEGRDLMATITPPIRRGPAIKPLHIAGFGIILIAVIYGFFGLRSGFRSYTTSVSEAMASSRSVQLAGFLGSTGEYDEAGRFTFMLQDE